MTADSKGAEEEEEEEELQGLPAGLDAQDLLDALDALPTDPAAPNRLSSTRAGRSERAERPASWRGGSSSGKHPRSGTGSSSLRPPTLSRSVSLSSRFTATATSTPVTSPSRSTSPTSPTPSAFSSSSAGGPGVRGAGPSHPRQLLKQGRLLLVSLIENYCALYDNSPLGPVALAARSGAERGKGTRYAGHAATTTATPIGSALPGNTPAPGVDGPALPEPRGRTLFLAICQHLCQLGIIRPGDWAEELGAVRGLYRRGFHELFATAVHHVESGDGMGRRSPTEPPSIQELQHASSASPSDSGWSIVPAPVQPSLPALGALLGSGRRPLPPAAAAGAATTRTTIIPALLLPDALQSVEWIPPTRSRYLEDFVELGTLGCGAYGSVFHVRHRLDGTSYAIKKVRFRSGAPKLLREVKYHAKLYHRNLVRYYSAWIEDVDHRALRPRSCIEGAGNEEGACPTSFSSLASTADSAATNASAPSSTPGPYCMTLCIQMELCHDTLSSWLVRRNTAPTTRPGTQFVREEECLAIFRDVARGLEYVHAQGLIHRDVKPQNIYYQRVERVWKIGDFGLVTSGEPDRPESLAGTSSLFDASLQPAEFARAPTSLSIGGSATGEHTTGIGTFIYASPEQIAASSTSHYTWSADIYSLGILLVELFVPFPTAMERALVLGKLRESEPLLPPEFVSWWPKQAALALWCVQPRPGMRPAASEILAYVETMDQIGADAPSTTVAALASEEAEGEGAWEKIAPDSLDSPVSPEDTSPHAGDAVGSAAYIRFLEDRLHSTQQECELLRKENVQLKAALSALGMQVEDSA